MDLYYEVLTELQVGERVIITINHGEIDTVTGVVEKTDHTKAMMFVTDTGRKMLVRFDQVEFVEWPSANDPKVEAVPPAPPAPTDGGGGTGPSGGDTEWDKNNLVNQSVTGINIRLNDMELKSLYNAMPKDDRKKLNRFYDMYKSGESATDREKMRSAALQAAEMIHVESAKHYQWSQEALKLCGAMLRRENCYDSDLFLVNTSNKMYPEAARFALSMDDHINGAVYATIALLDAAPELEHDLIIILAKCCLCAEDVSALPIIKELMPMRYETLMAKFITDLLAKKDVSIPDNLSFDQKHKTLEIHYPNRDVGTRIKDILELQSMGAAPVEQDDHPRVLEDVANVAWVSKTDFVRGTGEITCGTKAIPFRYADIRDKQLKQRVELCTNSVMDGSTCWVTFDEIDGVAKNLAPTDSPLKLAQKYTSVDQYYDYLDCCKQMLGSPDAPEALAAIVEQAVNITNVNQIRDYPLLEEVIELFEENQMIYPQTPRAISFVARIYYHLGEYTTSLKYLDDALSMQDLPPKLRAIYLSFYVRYSLPCIDEEFDEVICQSCINKATEWLELYDSEESLQQDVPTGKFVPKMLSWRCHAECSLKQLDAAEADLQRLQEEHANFSETGKRAEEVRNLRQELLIKEIGEPIDDGTDNEEHQIIPGDSEDGYLAEGQEDTDFPGLISMVEPDEEIPPYEDRDGWSSLGLNKAEVCDYALGLTGDNAVPRALTYLRAASSLNRDIQPLYNLIALAVNDPAYAADYTIAGLINMLDACDPAYQILGDYCMSAAFLRTSFQAGRGYDYSAKSVRDSISMLQSNPILHDICDLLEQFRQSAGAAIDIYADYRNHDVLQMMNDLNAIVRKASELNAKYIATVQRDDVMYVRLTKQVLFARDGYLARMLQYIMDRDRDALESAKDEFSTRFLNTNDQYSDKNISYQKVDDLIAEGWEQVGREMVGHRISGTLQGDRRNNLRSNITDILKVICQWYSVSEQSKGLSDRTSVGEAAYARIKPQIVEKLHDLSNYCNIEQENGLAPGARMGIYALAYTAEELGRRLTGEWSFGAEKYMFVDFLKSDNVMLDEDYLPEIESTFCILPEFNILARIRRHIDGENLSFADRIKQIYGQERSHNNYGSAIQIITYLESVGRGNEISLPQNAEQYVEQTSQQAQIRCRSFLESYALAVNYGQIMQSDTFCYTLEDTIRYWYSKADASKNYGFFVSLVSQAETQIHASAQQYESMLEEQLDALIENNQAQFARNTGYEEAIRAQIAQQNFIVAEDWMNRIRANDFSLVLEQPRALKCLENFWNNYVEIYQRVSDVDRTLVDLLSKYNYESLPEAGRQLLRAWMDDRGFMDNERIKNILNLLGWPSVTAEEATIPGGAKTELYRVTQDSKAVNTVAPPHPISAFGSKVAEQGMYVVCLYGPYSSDSLFEKIRALDTLTGNKIILLDCALGVIDRHALARKLKQKENGIQNVYLVIDRVSICYLADNYSADLVNKNLMSIGIPFSYCMPYVVASILPMPPEIFIGRKHELSEIESPSGVNLIYGGRQLGKSALFKKARVDIDGNQGRKAVLVDINGCDCASAAQKVAYELSVAGVLEDVEGINDWDALAAYIRDTLRTHDEIKYLLLMMDEADAFIQDCGNVNYTPIAKLKDVQQLLPGRFKFVLAGLHNIVRFNRAVALGNNAVITHMPSLKVTPFRAPEAEELLTVPLSYLGLSLPSKVTVSQVLATVNYFPGLIQLYAQKLIESLRAADYAGYDQRKTPPYVITDDHIRRVMADKEFVDQIHEKFVVTLMLDQDQGYCYYPLALLFGWMYYEEPMKSKQAGYSAEDILKHAKSWNVRQIVSLDIEKINALLSELEDLNILRSISGSTYLLASKSFRDLLGSYEEIFEQLGTFGGEQA